MALGLLELYEVSAGSHWLQAAIALAETIRVQFADADGRGFCQVSADHEQLIARRKDFVDSAVPAGNSLAAELFLRLGVLLDHEGYVASAVGIFELMADAMGAQPLAFGHLLCALDFYLHRDPEIAIIGDPAGVAMHALMAEVRRRYLPNKVVAFAAPGDTQGTELVPLLAGRGQLEGKATAYVCHNYACRLPVTEPETLAQQLTP